MKREYAEQIVNQYLTRIYSFVKKRISDEQDVKDIVQDICLNLYRSLMLQEVTNIDGFIWTVARHTLTNYYRGKQKSTFNVSIEKEQMEFVDHQKSALENMVDMENYEKIRKEIAYLSKIQRSIVIMYYYEEKKQSEIAEILGIPLGTVKWHLGVAKEELKKGMEKMRDNKDLKFNPVEFSLVGLSGKSGEMGAGINFLRSSLAQNIVYCVRKEYMTIEEIADNLSVSPVFIESELDFLEEYSIVLRKKDKYIANVLIEEPTEEMIEKQSQLYELISSKIAGKLFDKIVEGQYLESEDIYGPKNDNNYIMWSLMFYLLAVAESDYFEEKIPFDQAAVIRADGGRNIINCTVKNRIGEKYIKSKNMDKMYGPCWNGDDEITLWLIDGDWTEKRVGGYYGGPNIVRDLNLLKRFVRGEKLSVDEYTFMLEKHYIRKVGEDFELAIVMLKNGDTKDKLFELTKQIKNEVLGQCQKEIQKYKNWVLDSEEFPKHLRIQEEFCLQYLFHSDGWFMLYAKEFLVNSERLKYVEDEQKYSVTQLMII